MSSPRSLGLILPLVALAGGCQRDAGAPAVAPTRIETRATLPATAPAGSAVATPLAVAVLDAEGRPVSRVSVLFAVTAGNGRVAPASAPTDANGRAEALLTLGTIAGANEVTASVRGIVTTVRFSTSGIAGAADRVTITPRPARFAPGTDSVRLTTSTFDAFGNRTNQLPTLVVRDTSLLFIDGAGFAHARRRGGVTYVVATTTTGADSVLAIVLAAGDSPCTAVATGRGFALGEVATNVESSGLCVRAAVTDEEYVLVPYFASSVPSSNVGLQVQGYGVAPTAAATAVAPTLRLASAQAASTTELQARFDRDLRRIERRELPRLAAGARAWHAGSRRASERREAGVPNAPSFATVPANAAVGDLVTFNVNANDFCSNPSFRTARIAAVSARAFVLADTANPSGGFTDADYRSFATTFDTLVDAVDVEAFGEPSDVDQNGRVLIFFTSAVNALTPRGSSGVILGFYFSRDLLPKTAAQSTCAGSNVAEMFYLLVPDSAAVAGDIRSKAFVRSVSNGTIAHEYQHLINASRRLYVNGAAEVNEETWLNEGLSHIAEELVFYRAAHLTPRQNLGGGVLSGGGATADAFREFQSNNLRRYATYLRATSTEAPVGVVGDDDVETRGAAWSFLRYAADRVAPGDATLWFRLVNAKTIGLANLTAVLARDPTPLLRDWAVSTYADDAVPSVASRFSQTSWNFRTLFPADGSVFPLTDPALERRLADASPSGVAMRGGAVSFFRFTVRAESEALITVSSGGVPAPASIQLALVRLR